MADAYWRYGDGRQQQAAILAPLPKRPRTEFEMPSGPEMSNFYNIREENASGHRVNRDIDTINASYDRYLRAAQMPPIGGDAGRSMTGGLLPLPHDDPRVIAMASSDAAKSRPMPVGGHREVQLPPDASSTLFVEGLPANCSRREVAHIFRPFVGYKEVRLVSKESRRPGGDPLLLCFVDFQSPAHAATAMDALQGYEFDEHERDSVHLRLQFARYPGARSGGGGRGKR